MLGISGTVASGSTENFCIGQSAIKLFWKEIAKLMIKEALPRQLYLTAHGSLVIMSDTIPAKLHGDFTPAPRPEK